MSFSPLIDKLIDSLRCLPGVGPKTAQRMAFHLLEHHRDSGHQLAAILERAMTEVKHCKHCRTFSETELCRICSAIHRDSSLLCIVESPSDVLAIEQTGVFKGRYFVLMGHLSPLDGIGPNELGIDSLLHRLREIPPEEIVLATNPTVEGEATAHYLAELIKSYYPIKISRIAHGVPLGGELEYIDGGTLVRSFMGRETIS